MRVIKAASRTGFRVLLLLMLLLPFSRCLAAAPPPLLKATVYTELASLDGYWVSEKLDGVRAYWDGRQLRSRQGNVYQAPDWFTENLPQQPLDGELWMGRGTFARLSGAVRRHQPDDHEWQRIRYMLFDLPQSALPFSGRLQQMKKLVEGASSPYVAVIKQVPATTHKDLMVQLDGVIAKGGEGLMLHHGDSLYKAGRSDRLLKVKRYQDAEAVVVGHTEGNGKYKGMLGALIVELPDKRRFRIGTGLSDEQRRAPPAIGTIITYQYIGLTASGLPRFASFLRVRNDEPSSSMDNHE